MLWVLIFFSVLFLVVIVFVVVRVNVVIELKSVDFFMGIFFVDFLI